MKLVKVNLGQQHPRNTLQQMNVILETLPELPVTNPVVRKVFAGEFGDLYQSVKNGFFKGFAEEWILTPHIPIYLHKTVKLSVKEKFAILAVGRGLSRYFGCEEKGTQARLFASVMFGGFSEGAHERKAMREAFKLIEKTECPYNADLAADEAFVAKVETFCHLFPKLIDDMVANNTVIAQAMKVYADCRELDEMEAGNGRLLKVYFDNGWISAKTRRRFPRLNGYRLNSADRVQILRNAFTLSADGSKELPSATQRYLHWNQKSPANWVTV